MMTNRVMLVPSGLEFNIEQDETILGAALRHDLAFPYGCKNGSCGSCKAKLIAGQTTYPQCLPEALLEDDTEKNVVFCCQAVALSDLQLEVKIDQGSNLPIRTLPCRVMSKEQLSPDVYRLLLKLPNKETLQFRAGQYLDILLPDGHNRSFSLANSSKQGNQLELHVRYYTQGLFSEQVANALTVGTLLKIRGPLGSFYLREDSDRPIVLVAGGTGFAPLKSILEYSFAESLDRPIHLYWGARSLDDLYLHDLVMSWVAEHRNFSYTPVLSEPLLTDLWQGRTGFVHTAVLTDIDDLRGYDVYVCGPPVMVRAARASFLEKGLLESNFFSDSFEFAPR